jgi:uncharacterized protein (TIGR03067 family)
MRCVTGMLLLLVGFHATIQADEARDLQGSWILKAIKIAGTDAPEEMRARGKVVITGNKLTVKGLGTTDIDYTFEAKAAKEKSTIDLTPHSKGIEPKVSRGIYKLEKSQLTLCVSDEEERPTAFESKPKSTMVLMVLERAKE